MDKTEDKTGSYFCLAVVSLIDAAALFLLQQLHVQQDPHRLLADVQ